MDNILKEVNNSVNLEIVNKVVKVEHVFVKVNFSYEENSSYKDMRIGEPYLDNKVILNNIFNGDEVIINVYKVYKEEKDVQDNKKVVTVINIKMRFFVHYLDRIIEGFKVVENKVQLKEDNSINNYILIYVVYQDMIKQTVVIDVGKNNLVINIEQVLVVDDVNVEKISLDNKVINIENVEVVKVVVSIELDIEQIQKDVVKVCRKMDDVVIVCSNILVEIS